MPTKKPNIRGVKSRNYWNTCGRDLDEIPGKPCANSIPQKDEKGRITREPENEWWIDSPEDNYCFWQWVQRNSTPDGKMEPMQQNEIAKLFGCSPTKIHFIIKEALNKLKAKNLHLILKDYALTEPEGGSMDLPIDPNSQDDSDS